MVKRNNDLSRQERQDQERQERQENQRLVGHIYTSILNRIFRTKIPKIGKPIDILQN